MNARHLASQAGSPAEFGRKTGMSDSQVSQLIGENPTKNIGNKIARRIEEAFDKNAGWLDAVHVNLKSSTAEATPDHPRRRLGDFELVSEDATNIEVGRIEYWNAKGSCGGGFLNYDQLPAGHLVKEISFFKKYGIKPENVFAIYADGDSMADFIVDGDIVIFDKTQTEPRNGKIFVIEHPEGLRIKQLRRDIDGSWVLESKNVDKRMFPDERIDPDHLELLKIRGQFVYRQGG
jgi:phage repressor protein C with HTH and peptisase S24 domain